MAVITVDATVMPNHTGIHLSKVQSKFYTIYEKNNKGRLIPNRPTFRRCVKMY